MGQAAALAGVLSKATLPGRGWVASRSGAERTEEGRPGGHRAKARQARYNIIVGRNKPPTERTTVESVMRYDVFFYVDYDGKVKMAKAPRRRRESQSSARPRLADADVKARAE